jgi:hypothetical protein
VDRPGRHNDDLFDQLQDHLVDGGVAVLTYDKWGAGHPDGVWHSATVDDLAGDGSAVLAAPSAGSAGRRRPVGVLGHSEGGLVALRSICLATSSDPGEAVGPKAPPTGEIIPDPGTRPAVSSRWWDGSAGSPRR